MQTGTSRIVILPENIPLYLFLVLLLLLLAYTYWIEWRKKRSASPNKIADHRASVGACILGICLGIGPAASTIIAACIGRLTFLDVLLIPLDLFMVIVGLILLVVAKVWWKQECRDAAYGCETLLCGQGGHCRQVALLQEQEIGTGVGRKLWRCRAGHFFSTNTQNLYRRYLSAQEDVHV